MSFKNLETRKIYNDVIDEAYELEEDDNDVLNEKKIENNIVDGEVNVSDDSQNYIPTPRDEDELENEDDDDERGNATQRVYGAKEGFTTEESELDFGNNNFRKNQNRDSEKEIESLNLDQHTKDLFKYIKVHPRQANDQLYKPKIQELRPKLKPFVQDYVPAVGEVDAFLKVPKPDGSKENLGLLQLDEPCLNQSKRSYLDLLIRQFYKGRRKDHHQNIHMIQNAHKKQKEVAGWISDVEQVQRKKQAPSVFYSNKMPEIDQLMQVFPENTADRIGKESSGEALSYQESDIPLETLAKALCGVVGIPVHGQSRESRDGCGGNRKTPWRRRGITTIGGFRRTPRRRTRTRS